MRVLDVDRYQGTIVSGSVLTNSNPAFNSINPQSTWTGTISLPNQGDLTDSNLSLCICWQRSVTPGVWEQVDGGSLEWSGGQGIPIVTWRGLARRMRLVIDILRAKGDAFVALGADITQS